MAPSSLKSLPFPPSNGYWATTSYLMPMILLGGVTAFIKHASSASHTWPRRTCLRAVLACSHAKETRPMGQFWSHSGRGGPRPRWWHRRQGGGPPVGRASRLYHPLMQQRTADVNPVAVASFVLALLGYVGVAVVVGPALGIVLGEVAKRQIARTNQAGIGLARWGAILGAAWFVLVLGTVLVSSLTRLRP